jgi:preprotein translocase subunit SecA
MIQKILSLFLGNKSDRDLKEIQPYIDRILAVEPSIQALDNDGLRAKTAEFRARLIAAQKDERNQIAHLRAQAEQEKDADAKNSLFLEVDALDKKAYEKAEAELAEILPEAFSVIRETARRLSAGNFRVTATDMDRELAQRMDALRIEGD